MPTALVNELRKQIGNRTAVQTMVYDGIWIMVVGQWMMDLKPDAEGVNYHSLGQSNRRWLQPGVIKAPTIHNLRIEIRKRQSALSEVVSAKSGKRGSIHGSGKSLGDSSR